MSLFKQLQLLVTLLLALILVVVLKINFDNAQEFATHQLFNTGKNVANVLALTLGPQTSDQPLMETTINAMFDGGHFKEITLTRQDGTVVCRRTENVVIDGVPAIFIDHVDLYSPAAQAQVSSGWSIFGTLRVKGHPGPFYITLWETFQRLCILFVVMGAAAVAASYLILRLVLQSLERIQRQAHAIGQNKFMIIEDIPRAPELKKVVIAMNTMAVKVEQIFHRQLDNIRHYRELQYRDPRSGLHNRAYFVKQLAHFLESDTEKAHGHVLIVGMAGMDKHHIPVGHPRIQKFYQDMADILRTATRSIEDSVTACLHRHEIAAILPNCHQDKGVEITESIVKRLQALVASMPELAEDVCMNGGMAPYDYTDSVGTVLSRTDYALSSAQSGLPGKIEAFQDQRDHAVMGKIAWKTMLVDALAQRQFFLTAQPVLCDTIEFHKEIYINLKDPDGVAQQAGYFMPMVINLGLAGKLDRYVLESAATLIEATPGSIYAVNISADFCKDRLSFTWLRKFLSTNKFLRKRLVLEIHENTLRQYPDIVLDLAGMLKGMGFGFGIDHFTMNEVSFGLLKELQPDYLKIEKGYLVDVDHPENTQIAANALLTVSESLGIIVVATRIESEDERVAIAANNINCFQGHGIAGIAPLES